VKGLRPGVLDVRLQKFLVEGGGPIARPVIGEHPLHGDAVLLEEPSSAAPKTNGRGCCFIIMDL
jgi:hypothetical protein